MNAPFEPTNLTLPSSLRHLEISDEDVAFSSLPPKLLYLELSLSLLPPLPPTLTHLIVDSDTFPLPDLPPTLTHLSVPMNFTHSLPYIPNSIVEFKVSLKNYKQLQDMFSMYKDGIQLLTHVSFSGGETEDLLAAIHDSNVTNLVFNARSTSSIDYLPVKLRNLRFWHYSAHSIDHLPSSITHLSIRTGSNIALDHLPSSLTNLKIGFGGSSASQHFNQHIDHLPPALTQLYIESDLFDLPLDHLPARLNTLAMFSPSFNQSLDHLPSTLTHLTLAQFQLSHSDYLPPKFNKPLDNLPSLTYLVFTSLNYSNPLDHLPSSLTHLIIIDGRNSYLHTYYFTTELHYLPRNLHFLTLPKSYNKKLPRLPPFLVKLVFCGEFVKQDTSQWSKGMVVVAHNPTGDFEHTVEI